jgi:hypothetical protein
MSKQMVRSRPENRGRGITWQSGLLLGLCFGLGYGLTHRLLPLNPLSGFEGQQPFGVKAFPGTGLRTFRENSGDAPGSLRADLDRIEREKTLKEQSAREEEEMAKRRASIEEREARRLDLDWSDEGQRDPVDSGILPEPSGEQTPSPTGSIPLPAQQPPPVTAQPEIREPPPPQDLPPLPPLPQP